MEWDLKAEAELSTRAHTLYSPVSLLTGEKGEEC